MFRLHWAGSSHHWRVLIAALSLLALCIVSSGKLHAAEHPQGKLPDIAIPEAYRLELTIVPERKRFSGQVEIDIRLQRATKSLYIHGRDLNMHGAYLRRNGKQLPIIYKEVDPLGVARLDFGRKIPAGKATLVFDYDAAFGEDPAGLFRVKVGKDWYSWTQFQSIDARGAFPSFDQPGFKTPFTVSLITQPGLLAVSNAPETGTPVQHGELVKHTFAPTPPLPTYLVAFVVGPFITAEGVLPPTTIRKTPLPLRIVATRNQTGKLDYALTETRRIVELLESYFDSPFPFPKLDQIACPILPGAMENAGADTYEDNILLLDQGASTEQKQQFGMVVAHELSHQWFGDYVTPAWWDDIWLNESFANWMGYRIGGEWRPELNIGVNAIDEALDAMDTDALAAGRPIHQPITNNNDVDSVFDEVTYGKGGQVVAMIASYLGDDEFRKGVRLHMQRHPYGSATTDDFFHALSDAVGEPRILAALQSFVDQQGVPVIDIARDGTGRYTATQSRYSKLGASKSEQKWTVPLCVRRGERTSCTLMDQRTQAINAEGDGVLVPNAGGTGYYRYNLNPSDWDTLIASGAQLPAGEGLAASDSLWAQFSTGRVSLDQLLTAAKVFAGNPDSNVAVFGGEQLATLRTRGLIEQSSLPDYRRVVAAIYGPRFAELGFEPRAKAYLNDDPDRQKLRQSLVELMADEAHDASLRATLTRAAAQYLQGDTQALDQSLFELAFAVHVEDGNLATTQDLYRRAVEATDELFRDAALEALTAGHRPDDAQWLISKFNDSKLRWTDRLMIMHGLMAENETRDLAFDWLIENFESFTAGAGLFTAAEITKLPSDYCSVEKAAEIERLLRPRVTEAGYGELPFERMVENVRTCGVVKERAAKDVAASLRRAGMRH